MAALGRGALRGASRAGLLVGGAGVVAAGAVGVALAASHGTAGKAPGGDDLRRDLDAAAASAAFAPAARGAAPVRFVSPLELGESPAPTGPTRAVGAAPVASPHAVARTRVLRAVSRSASPEHVPVRTVADHTPAVAPARAATTRGDAAPAPGATEQVALAAEPASAGAGTYTAPSGPGPAVASGPSAGSSGDTPGNGESTPVPRGHGGWGGGIIGVVIRGGGIGDRDHCGRDRPGSRMPLPGSIGGGGMGGGRWPGRF